MATVPEDIVGLVSEEERERIVMAIAGLPLQSPSRSPGPPPPITPDRPSVSPVRRRWTKWVAVAAPLAFAAILVLTILPRPGAERPLPGYSMTVSGGLKDFRGAAPGAATPPVARAGRSTEIVVVCRPDVAVEGPVAARLFLVRGEAVFEVTAQFHASPAGSFEIRFNPVKDGGASAGSWGLRAVVGSPAVLQALPATAAIAATAGPRRQWLKGALDVVED